ncbi:MAG: 2'-deoxycytidine 5'-triphosphate deaminase [Parcubacteria group bacterium]|nr:2'-deoxycytidine 5'-triphosphate deaminase [Parcubacteria group bacterium]
MRKEGTLPSHTIIKMLEKGVIVDGKTENINPASIDISVCGDEVYRLGSNFLLRDNECVRDVLPHVGASKHNLSNPLEKGIVYLARVRESFHLSKLPGVYGFSNPKSSSGRTDIHVRLMADRVPRYDKIPRGYDGNLWMTILPNSFPVKIRDGERLAQVRFFDADTRLGKTELELGLMSGLVFDMDGKPFSYTDLKINDNDESVILTADLSSKPVVGYECRGTNTIFDFSVLEQDMRTFFHPILNNETSSKEGRIILRRNCFYILSTNEYVRVPPDLSCVMMPMDERSGEFRAHYAGFIDPGWGYGIDGVKNGRPLTLEVRPFEDLCIRHGQPIAKIYFERMSEEPSEHYDTLDTSHYRVQSGPVLSKQFQ